MRLGSSADGPKLRSSPQGRPRSPPAPTQHTCTVRSSAASSVWPSAASAASAARTRWLSAWNVSVSWPMVCLAAGVAPGAGRALVGGKWRALQACPALLCRQSAVRPRPLAGPQRRRRRRRTGRAPQRRWQGRSGGKHQTGGRRPPAPAVPREIRPAAPARRCRRCRRRLPAPRPSAAPRPSLRPPRRPGAPPAAAPGGSLCQVAALLLLFPCSCCCRCCATAAATVPLPLLTTVQALRAPPEPHWPVLGS